MVGAGPGDPKLLTLRGRELLAQADVVAYDHLVSTQLLSFCPPAAKIIYVGKESDAHAIAQSGINRLLIRYARAGRQVVRLKGGDPFLFGRGGEEALDLAKAGVSFEVVPGVTSAIAVPAYAGIPVTERHLSSSVAIVTGHEDPAKEQTSIRWRQLANACDTLVFLMGVGNLPAIAKKLIAFGRSPKTPCAVIEWGTLPRQKVAIGNLADIAAKARKAQIRPPAVCVVGDVVSLRSKLRWFEDKPLFGKRILVTRSAENAASLSGQLQALGAEVEELPAIALAPVKANGLFRQAIRQLPETDWVFFTSPEGIDWFSRMLKPLRKDLRWLKDCHIGAIGSKTAAAVEARGLHVDFIPRTYSQEGILRDFPSRLCRGRRAAIFSAALSRDALSDGLRRQGMRVVKVPIYQTLLPKASIEKARTLFDREFDWVTATSASCVDHLHQALKASGRPAVFKKLRFASIGPVTSETIRKAGGCVAVKARVSTIEGLVEAITRKS